MQIHSLSRPYTPTLRQQPACGCQQQPEAQDSVSLGQRPEPLTYVPTTAGTFAMLGLVAGPATLGGVLSGTPAGAAAGALIGLGAAFAAGHFMDKEAEATYRDSGQASLWMRPAFTTEDITGMPPTAIGVRGLA
ncbi:MAG: hypothetical protein AB7S38_34955 [Vulcanimicrobiota bacterium]